jgi:hypothetical protein
MKDIHRNTFAVAGGLILASALVASLAYADSGKINLPDGFSHWTSAVPDGISFSVSDGGRTHPLQVFRDQNGNLARGTESQIYSSNWSGYVLANYETNKTYTSAAGTWTVPSVTAPAVKSAGYSSSWIGIGGFCENSNCNPGDGTLIQLGTESDVNSSGKANYYAWYEMLPQAETEIRGFTVAPGDNITATLALQSVTRGRQTWKLALTDAAKHVSWSTDVQYQSSELSAEWIEEAPSSYSGVLPLADYNTIKFNPENNGIPYFASNYQVILDYDPYGQTSNPSTAAADDAFNACWGTNKTLTVCAAPKS